MFQPAHRPVLRHGDGALATAKGRANLEIRTGVRAQRIRVENGRAVGVEFKVNGTLTYARAAREVKGCE